MLNTKPVVIVQKNVIGSQKYSCVVSGMQLEYQYRKSNKYLGHLVIMPSSNLEVIFHRSLTSQSVDLDKDRHNSAI